MTKPGVGDPTTKDFADEVIDNLNFLNSQVGASGGITNIPNGSFENDGDSDGVPDSWTQVDGSSGGATYSLSGASGDQVHGQYGYKVTADATNGGGTLTTDDFLACNPSEWVNISFWHKIQAGNDWTHKVTLLWYQYDQTASAVTTSTDIYNEATSETAWTRFTRGGKAPSDAAYFKVRLDSAPSGGTTATAVYWDDVRIWTRPDQIVLRETGSTTSWSSGHTTATISASGTLATNDGQLCTIDAAGNEWNLAPGRYVIRARMPVVVARSTTGNMEAHSQFYNQTDAAVILEGCGGQANTSGTTTFLTTVDGEFEIDSSSGADDLDVRFYGANDGIGAITLGAASGGTSGEVYWTVEFTRLN